MKRRDILKISAASLSYFSVPSIAQAAVKGYSLNSVSEHQEASQSKKMVLIVLRGAMDGLQATVPLFDKNLMSLRRDLVAPIKDAALPTKHDFALHPQLKFTHSLFKKQQLNTIIATSTLYRERSHFAGQDFLESGFKQPDVDNGWLARLLTQLNSVEVTSNGLAVARSLPVAMRGGNKATTWYPSNLNSSSDDLHNRLKRLYEYDDSLALRLDQALDIQALVGEMGGKKQRGKLPDLAKSCATLLREPAGPSIAMLEMNGWDTHNRQVNRLNKNFKELDNGIKALHKELGDQWKNTILVVATEFGRTVKINGTGGTDHGTGTSMFIAGGSIKGGNVLGQWPGLAESELYQGRDLQPTSDSFSWIASAIKGHWDLDDKQIKAIFPDSVINKLHVI